MTPRRLTTALIGLALALLVSATTLAALARFGWLFELAVHFRVQYVAAAVLLAAAAAAMGRGGLALVALLVMVPNLWVAGPYLLPWLTPGAAGTRSADDIKLVSLNLYFRNPDHARVRDYLRHEQPDVLVLSELTPAWRTALRSIVSAYPYALAADQRGPWGLGVYSRYPLSAAQGMDLGVRNSFNVAATVALPGGPVRMVAVHLASPTRPRYAAARNRQLGRIAALLGPAPASVPRLLVGDLNITPFSPYLRDLLRATGLRDARQPQGLHGTWPRWALPLQIPIDLCIVDAALQVTSVTRGPAVGSDHYPLVVRIARAAGQRGPW